MNIKNADGAAGNDGRHIPVLSSERLTEMKRFERPNAKRAAVQILNTLIPYLLITGSMFALLRAGTPYLAVLPLAVPAGLFLIRLFIFFHDCCHGSYLKSKRAMTIIGTFLGILTFTAYRDWRHSHGIHHSTAGNLDRRGIGDVWTMTVDEYLGSTGWVRLKYRLFRNPLVMFGIGSIVLFLVENRLPGKHSTPEDKRSLLVTNAALILIAVAGSLVFGVWNYLFVQVSIMFFAGLFGIWLFYVQHQFDPAYWKRTEDWSSTEAALEGSSYYKLPAPLRWFSADIGLHHIHHLKPRIPNYRLRECLAAFPELELEDHLTIRKSLAAVKLNLWDEKSERLVRFKDVSGSRYGIGRQAPSGT